MDASDSERADTVVVMGDDQVRETCGCGAWISHKNKPRIAIFIVWSGAGTLRSAQDFCCFNEKNRP